MSKIAVLVAAYNAERWLPQCLNSLLRQTLEDIEVICIDDRSTDGTWQLLLDYEKRDPRIKLLQTTTNSGQAVARNLGLDAATAPFVCMVDADDWLSPDALSSALEIFNRYPDTDSVAFHLVKAFDDGARTEDYGLPAVLAQGGSIGGTKAVRLSLDGWQLHGLYVTRTELHRRYPFDTSSRLYSDDNTTHLHYLHSREVRACAGRYFYRQHASLTKSFNTLHFEYIRANLALRQTLIREGVDAELLCIYEGHRWVNFVSVYRTYLKHRSELSDGERQQVIQSLVDILRSFSRSSLPRHNRCKPGYWLLPRPFFHLQQFLYMFYKFLFDRNYINTQLA